MSVAGILEELARSVRISPVTEAACVDRRAALTVSRWLEGGMNASMEYMARNRDLRRDPTLEGRLLDGGVRSLACVAVPFGPAPAGAPAEGSVAAYAWGEDYHDVIRRRLTPLAGALRDLYGGQWRVCVDSAPVAERYWAVRSGLARMTRSGSVSVEGMGTRLFLAEIMTDLPAARWRGEVAPFAVTPHAPEDMYEPACRGCTRCTDCCPGGAIRHIPWEEGTMPAPLIDSRRCLSYLTIEHRGEWDDPVSLDVLATPAGRRTLFGCDICLRVCPLNTPAPGDVGKNGGEPLRIWPELSPRAALMSLTPGRAAAMTPGEFSALTRGSAIRRAGLAGLVRNALNILKNR